MLTGGGPSQQEIFDAFSSQLVSEIKTIKASEDGPCPKTRDEVKAMLLPLVRSFVSFLSFRSTFWF
jgi:hypothetical protein